MKTKTVVVAAIWAPVIAGCLMISQARAQELVLPRDMGFEQSEGYILGDINGQKGWETTGATARIIPMLSMNGIAALEIAPGSNSWVSHRFDASLAPVVYVSFLAKPNAGASIWDGSQFLIDGAGIGFVQQDGVATVAIFDTGQDEQTGQWRVLPPSLASSASASPEWMHISIRLDYEARSWDLNINGETLFAAQPLVRELIANGIVMMSAGSEAPARVDDLVIGDTPAKFSPLDITFRNMMGDGQKTTDTGNLAQLPKIAGDTPVQSSLGAANTATASNTTTTMSATLVSTPLLFEVFSPNGS